MAKINYLSLPINLRDEMSAYIERGERPGHFALAVLTNNLREAVGLAHPAMSIYNMRSLCHWLIWNAPPLSHGNDALVRSWMAKGGLQGIERLERSVPRLQDLDSRVE